MNRRNRLLAAAAILVASSSPGLVAQVIPVAPFPGTHQEGFEGTHSPSFQECVQFRLFDDTADLCTPGAHSSLITSGWIATCAMYRRSGIKHYASTPGLGGVHAVSEFTFDVPVRSFGGYFGNNKGASTVTVSFLDYNGVLLDSQVADVPPDCQWHWNGWETTGPPFSIVRVRGSAFSGGNILMDDMVVVQVPQLGCELRQPVPVVTGEAKLELTIHFIEPADVIVTFEYSLDGGIIWLPASPSATSPLGNPGTAAPIDEPQIFLWDTRADAVGIGAVATGVLMRTMTFDPGTGFPRECSTGPFDVDNTQPFCRGVCGDCDGDGAGPDVLDAMLAAVFAAGKLLPTFEQIGCCDVDGSGEVSILDALHMAQVNLGGPGALLCR